MTAINTVMHKDINTMGSTIAKDSLLKIKGEDGIKGLGIQDNINVKCSIKTRFSCLITVLGS